MNKIECESCIKRKTIYCPNSEKCFATKDKPFYQNRIMLLEETQKLKKQQKEFIEWLEENIYEIKYTYSQENGHYFKMDDILKTYQEILSKYKEITGVNGD